MDADTHPAESTVRKERRARVNWERMIALGFCAAFWAVVAYFVFR
jgi:hypothetical protein